MSQDHAEQGTFHVRPDYRFRLELRELLAYRELLYFFVWRDIKVLYKQTVLGAAWAVVQPLFTMALFWVIFGRVAGLPTDDLPPAVFFYSGLALWTYFANAVTRAGNSLVQHQTLITKVYFPRLLLPLAAVAAGGLDFFLSCLVLLGMLAWYGLWPTPAILALPLFLLTTFLCASAAGIWLAALNAVYRDVRYLMPFVMQVWLFASPVAYSLRSVPGEYHTLYLLNPMASAVEGFRWSLTGGGGWPGASAWWGLGLAAAFLLAGMAFFHRFETHLVDVV